MVLFGYGEFDWACREVTSYPICNLFFHQLLLQPPSSYPELLGLPPRDDAGFSSAIGQAGVGVLPSCAIPRFSTLSDSTSNEYGNIANIIASALSALIGLILAVLAFRRVAAVARSEISFLFLIYALTCVLQALDTGSFLRQGSVALVWISGVHQGAIVAFFYVLLYISLLFLQPGGVEDGTIWSHLTLFAGIIVSFIGSTYIALDVAFAVTDYFQPAAGNIADAARLHSAWLFSLLIVWPAAAAFLYFVITMYVTKFKLGETKPLLWWLVSAFFFVLSQLDFFILGHTICHRTGARVDGSFVATILETLAILSLYFGWHSITETDYDSGSDFGYSNTSPRRSDWGPE